jgi:hypothetical protein
MASRQSIPQSIEPSKLAIVIPIQQSVVFSVTQDELERLLLLRNDLKKCHEQIEFIESDVKARLDAGASVEEGVHVAALKENYRRNVAWKDVAIRLAERLKMDGEVYCARVLASTKPNRTISLEIR